MYKVKYASHRRTSTTRFYLHEALKIAKLIDEKVEEFGGGGRNGELLIRQLKKTKQYSESIDSFSKS